jgi:hypothetical protein
VPEDRAEVRSLWRKPARGAGMQPVAELPVSRLDGVRGDVSPGAGSPRQLLVTSWEDLRALSLPEDASRCNIVVEGGEPVRPGALLEVGSAAVRITMRCTPCARGARLAGTSAGCFGRLPRYLAVVVEGGTVTVGDRAEVSPGVFECPPERLADRCAWAVRAVPAGSVVSTRELLTALGADRAYARAMPRWLAAAGLDGAPVHRVLRGGAAGLAGPPPSWAPDAMTRLAAESADPTDYPLSEAIWSWDVSERARTGRRDLVVGT